MSIDTVVTQMWESGIHYGAAVRVFQRTFIVRMLEACNGNQCEAARRMGMHRNTLRRAMKELSITPRFQEIA